MEAHGRGQQPERHLITILANESYGEGCKLSWPRRVKIALGVAGVLRLLFSEDMFFKPDYVSTSLEDDARRREIWLGKSPVGDMSAAVSSWGCAGRTVWLRIFLERVLPTPVCLLLRILWCSLGLCFLDVLLLHTDYSFFILKFHMDWFPFSLPCYKNKIQHLALISFPFAMPRQCWEISDVLLSLLIKPRCVL